MRWDGEDSVKVCIRDTVGWLVLSYDARSLFLQILRKADRSGEISLGRFGRPGVAVAVGARDDWSRLEPALAELERDGCVVVQGPILSVRGFPGTEHHELPSPLVRLLTPDERAAKAAETAKRESEWRAGEVERRERIKGKPHVYFIQQGDSGAIKIGCSKNPAQRLAGLQTGHSEPLRLLTCAVGSQDQERALHDRFAHLRVSGEWFRPAEELLSYIRLVTDRRAL